MESGIYSRVPQERLTDILKTLQAYTGLPIRLIDENGRELQVFGEELRYCTLIRQHVFAPERCTHLRARAGECARDIGEAYIFSCHASMSYIAFPLINRAALLGSVVLGPFLMEQPDTTLVSELADRQPISPMLALDLYDELGGAQVITPERVQLLKKLVDYLLSALIPSERALLMQTQEKAYQQSRINETIQLYKEQERRETVSPSLYFFQQEKELLSKVRTGDVQAVKALLNEMLGYVLFSQGGSLESVRVRSIELTTLLSRVAIDGGARVESIYELNGKLMPQMVQERDMDALCLRLQEVAESFMSAMFYGKDKGNHYIRKALRYMMDHYSEHLELGAVAEYVQLSPSYFSTLFRQVVGVSFREQLCRIRIEESKQLLLSTDYSLTDIAIAVGFPDQSYYCKVFRRIVGLTPGKFRD